NGISAKKKVHELRKIFGDAIVKQNGIFAGSAQLRHSTIQMTASHYTDPRHWGHSTIKSPASHYTDPRQRAALPVGKLFSDDGTHTMPDRPSQSEPSAQRRGTNNFKAGIKNGV